MKKVCIFLTFAKEIDNYSNIVKLFNKENLILCISDFDKENFVILKKFCHDKNIEYITLSEVLKKKIKFNVLITQNFELRCFGKFVFKHFIKFLVNKFFFKSKIYVKPIIKKNFRSICKKLFKFPKGLDASNFKEKKFFYERFDQIFCHSEYEKDELNKLGLNNVNIIGFPRYTIKIKKNINTIKNELNIKNKDKVLFWLPSRLDKAESKNSNIYLWIKILKKFTKEYKFICRPHPDLISKKLIKDLYKENFFIDCNKERKLSDIYEASDLIFCDYGETIFSSLYFKKKVILLNYLNNINDRFLNQIYLDVKIRDYCPNFNIDDSDIKFKIDTLINNEEEWKMFEEKRKPFFKKIFPTEEQKIYNSYFIDVVNKYLHND